MNIETASRFLVRIRDHRQAEQKIWDELRAHPEYERLDDRIIEEALDAMDACDAAAEVANDAMESFNFVVDPPEEPEAARPTIYPRPGEGDDGVTYADGHSFTIGGGESQPAD